MRFSAVRCLTFMATPTSEDCSMAAFHTATYSSLRILGPGQSVKAPGAYNNSAAAAFSTLLTSGADGCVPICHGVVPGKEEVAFRACHLS